MDLGADLNILKMMWQSGLVVKLVLLLLISFSIFSWTVIFKKRKQLKEIDELNKKFFNAYKSCENLKDVYLKTEQMPDSPYKLLFQEGYQELQQIKQSFGGDQGAEKLREHFEKFGLVMLERALKRGAVKSSHQLDQFQSILASIGSISPFVGLFGTVWGIIDSFEGLAQGGGTLEAVAPGIAEALVATAVGLAAAIPAVWFFNQFNSRNDKILADLQTFGEDFLNFVERSIQ